MSETRFTPGPWTFSVHAPTGDCGFRAEGTGVFIEAFADIRHAGEFARDEARANAHLIAAAPTLYDTAAEVAPALRRLIAEMSLGPDGEGRDWLDTLTACADDLDAAMAKARGEA